DVARVGGVRGRRGGEDSQVGVAEQGAVGVAGYRVVAGGQQDQAVDLGDPLTGYAERGERRGGEGGAGGFVVVAGRLVHRVVEPGGQPHGVGIGRLAGVRVHHGQYRDQVAQPV